MEGGRMDIVEAAEVDSIQTQGGLQGSGNRLWPPR